VVEAIDCHSSVGPAPIVPSVACADELDECLELGPARVRSTTNQCGFSGIVLAKRQVTLSMKPRGSTFIPPRPANARRLVDRHLVAPANGEPPLLALRTRRGVPRDEVVDSLIRMLCLDRAKRAKVKGYYHQLETGQLELRRVDRRVFGALAESLVDRFDDLRAPSRR
jgi:hypothetical protein